MQAGENLMWHSLWKVARVIMSAPLKRPMRSSPHTANPLASDSPKRSPRWPPAGGPVAAAAGIETRQRGESSWRDLSLGRGGR